MADEEVIVYKIRCRVNGKSYFGITRHNEVRRWAQHIKDSKRACHQSVLYRTIRRYGAENFTIEVVYCAVNAREAQTVERAMIAQYGTLAPNGMNASTGGERYCGVARSPEVIERMRQSKLGTKMSDDARRKMSASHSGKPLSDKHRAALKEAAGRPERRAKISAWAKRRMTNPIIAAKHSENTRAIWARTDPAMREKHFKGMQEWNKRMWATRKRAVPKRSKHDAMIERWRDPAYRQRMVAVISNAMSPEDRAALCRKNSAAMIGAKRGPCSEDRKRKIGAARRASWDAWRAQRLHVCAMSIFGGW